ncbi:MAG: DUF3352 domain-containing protein [Arachnia propionica]|uniref:DUF3352 domain-containing protein n=1 Tax=Arachnia propionica TaxID=1750 RepID=UPI002700801C|nr:DUF3352 domain-containing protein [Arachnia propionica]
MNHPVNPPGPQYQQGPGQPQWQGPPPQGPGQPQWQGQPGYGPQGPVATAPQKKSRAKIIVAAVVALAVIAGAAFAAVMLLKKPATIAAANVLPDNPLIVASIDLNPAAPDQLAVKDLVEKFPEFTDGLDITEGNYKKALVEFAFKDNDDISWSDVEPWLGDSITFAAYASEEREPTVLVAFQQKDAAKAEEFAKKHLLKDGQASGEYRTVDDQLLVTDRSLPDADAVKKAPLANNEGFKADMAKLPGGLLATVWGEGKGLQQLAELTGNSTLATPGAVLEGRVAFGLRIEDSTVVLEGIAWQEQKIENNLESASELVGNLPGDTIAAVGSSTNDASIDQAWEQLEQQGLSSSDLQSIGISSKEDLKALVGQQFGLYVPQSTVAALSEGRGATPTVGLAVKTNDPSGHQSVLERIGRQLPEGLKHHTEGDKVFTTWNGSPEDLAKPKTRLADDATYKKVVKDADKANAIIFVNIGSIVSSLPNLGSGSDVEALRKFDGVGMTVKMLDEHYGSVTLRVSFK